MALTKLPYDPVLDLAPWTGQRKATYKFLRYDSSGQFLGELTPLRDQPAVLSHDTTRLIKRSLRMRLGAADSSKVNPAKERVKISMEFPSGASYPLGRYLYTDASQQFFTSGTINDVVLSDDMFTIDQKLTQGFVPSGSITDSLVRLLSRFSGITLELEASAYSSLAAMAWAAGTTSAGQVIDALALAGDYFSPWFDNLNRMRFIRSFNPANVIVDFDWDKSNQVFRNNIVFHNDLLNAPNRFMVVSNVTNQNGGDSQQPVLAVATVPASAPHSFENRGFYITDVVTAQVGSQSQVSAMANNLVQRQTVIDQVTVTTAPDPRHDSYNVIRWQGSNWLEVSWSMNCIEGTPMQHTLRKAYGDPTVADANSLVTGAQATAQ